MIFLNSFHQNVISYYWTTYSIAAVIEHSKDETIPALKGSCFNCSTLSSEIAMINLESLIDSKSL